MQAIIDGWWSWIMPLSWQLALWITLIAGVAWLARRASPRVCYWLWVLVLVKVFLPPSLAVDWGVGSWGLAPLWQSLDVPVAQVADVPGELVSTASDDLANSMVTPTDRVVHPRTVLFGIWLIGSVALFTTTVWQYYRLAKTVRRMKPIDEGPVRISLEKMALQAYVRNPPVLVESSDVTNPFLLGLFHPRIVLPQVLCERLSPREVEGVLLHELNHHRRRDLWIGFLQAIAQCLLWFHPFLWWAGARLRHERECACDEDVLRQSDISAAEYGQSLLSVLSLSRGRVIHQPSLAGLFEPGTNVQQRLEEIMKERPRGRTSALWYVALAGLLLVFLPMAAIPTTAQDSVAAKKDDPPRPLPAWIAATTPAIGATDVDPDLAEITVSFDRDMSGGMSWTGQEFFPPADPTKKAHWRDKRTCVLPVNLAQGEYYRIGINAKSFQNFRSETGEPAPPSVIYFVTKHASKAVQSRVRIPQITKIVPENGAEDVNPDIKVIRVTLNVPMGGGMSWTGGSSSFPELRQGEQGKWSADGRTCVLPVVLKPDRQYSIGLNSLHHINFQSKWGVPLVPVEYRFKTSATIK